MHTDIIVALILAVAAETGIPPYFALSIALEENSTLNPSAVRMNNDGSCDRGIVQLNDSWYMGDWEDPEINIRAGCAYIKMVMGMRGVNTLWAVAVVYNAGIKRFWDENVPEASIEYANRVMCRYNAYTGYRY